MARKKPPPDVPADALALYDALIATHARVERKGAKSAYTSHNTHMFSFMAKDGTLALRLGKAEREAFVAEHQTEPVISYGAVMKEYVAVPPALLADTETLAPLFAASFAFVDAKPATPKKAAAKKRTAAKKKTAAKKSSTKR
ncbi:MAG: hypothetical protein AAF447_23475 [Myxococcota bacterium]